MASYFTTRGPVIKDQSVLVKENRRTIKTRKHLSMTRFLDKEPACGASQLVINYMELKNVGLILMSRLKASIYHSSYIGITTTYNHLRGGNFYER